MSEEQLKENRGHERPEKANDHQDRPDHGKQEFKIIVNARPKVVTKEKLTFREVVALAFETPPTGQDVLFTVTYKNGPRENPEGSLVDGQSVKIKNGMVFNVTQTNKS